MFSSSLCLLGCGPHMASKTTKKKAQAPAVHNISLIVFAATPTGGGGGIPLAYLLAAAASPTFTIVSDRTPTPRYRLAALLPKWRHTAIHPLLGTLLLGPVAPSLPPVFSYYSISGYQTACYAAWQRNITWSFIYVVHDVHCIIFCQMVWNVLFIPSMQTHLAERQHILLVTFLALSFIALRIQRPRGV